MALERELFFAALKASGDSGGTPDDGPPRPMDPERREFLQKALAEAEVALGIYDVPARMREHLAKMATFAGMALPSAPSAPAAARTVADSERGAAAAFSTSLPPALPIPLALPAPPSASEPAVELPPPLPPSASEPIPAPAPGPGPSPAEVPPPAPPPPPPPPPVTAAECVEAVDALRYECERMDAAADLRVLGGVGVLAALCAHPARGVRVAALWCAGTALQQNPRAQGDWLRHISASPPPPLSAEDFFVRRFAAAAAAAASERAADAAPSAAAAAAAEAAGGATEAEEELGGEGGSSAKAEFEKLVFCVSAAVRNFVPARIAWLKAGGAAALAKCAVVPRLPQRCVFRVVFLLSSVAAEVAADPPALRDAAPFWGDEVVAAVVAGCAADDVDTVQAAGHAVRSMPPAVRQREDVAAAVAAVVATLAGDEDRTALLGEYFVAA